VPTPDAAIQVIVIDPGHGGPDEGAVGAENTREKDITLAIALELRRILEGVHGKTAVLSRDRDVQLPVGMELSRFAARHQGDLIVSIHAGASLSPSAHGFELFCPSEAAILRAETEDLKGGTVPIALVQRRLDQNRAIAESVGAMLAETTGAFHRGIRHVGCRVLEGLRIPGFLIEVGFLTNPSEAVQLASESYQTEIATAIAAGIAGVSHELDQ
jgi:N-acetylmuramoyl-L-alanine amidase